MSDSGGGIFGGLLNPDPSALYTGLLSDPATKQALANRQLQAMAGAYGELAMPRPTRVPIGAVLGAGAAAAGNVMDTTMKSRLEAMQALQAQYQAQLLGQNVDFLKHAMDPNDPLHKIAFPDTATPPVATPSETGEPVKLGTGDTAGAQSILSGPLGDKVRYWASYHNVPPEVLASLVHVESSGKPNLTSPKGAQGLTQLMPGTQTDLGVTNPFDVDQSLSGGAKYLRQGLDKYNGDLTQALKYYHGGPDEKQWGAITQAYPGKVFAGTPVPPPQTAAVGAPTPLIPAPSGPATGAGAAPATPTPPAVPPVATAAPQPRGRVSIPGGPITAAERTAWVNSRVNGGQDTIEDWVAKARGQTAPAPVPQISPPGVAAGLSPGSGGGMPPVLPPGAGEIGAGGGAPQPGAGELQPGFGSKVPPVPPVAAGGGGAPALPGYLMPTPGSAKPLSPLVTPPGPAAATPPVAAAPPAMPTTIQPMTPQQVQATVNAARLWAMYGRPEIGKAMLENPAYLAAVEQAKAAAAMPYKTEPARPGTAITARDAQGRVIPLYQQPEKGVRYNPDTQRDEVAFYYPDGRVTLTGVPSAPSPFERSVGEARGKATYEDQTYYGPYGTPYQGTRAMLPSIAAAPPFQPTTFQQRGEQPPGAPAAPQPAAPAPAGTATTPTAPVQRPESAAPNFPVATPTGPKDIGNVTVDDMFPGGQGITRPPPPPPGMTYGKPSAAQEEAQKKDREQAAEFNAQATGNQKIYQDLGHLRDILGRGLATSSVAPLWADLSNLSEGLGLGSISSPTNLNDAYAFNKAATDLVFAAVKKLAGQVKVAEITGYQKANPSLVLPVAANYSILGDVLANGKWEDARAKLANQYLNETGGAPLSDFVSRYNAMAPLEGVTQHYREIFRQQGAKFPGDQPGLAPGQRAYSTDARGNRIVIENRNGTLYDMMTNQPYKP